MNNATFVKNYIKMTKEKLKTTRIEKGFSQQDVAKYLNTNQTDYSRKENGSISFTDEEWERIARLFEVELEDIYEEDATKSIVNNDKPIFNDNSGFYNQYSDTSDKVIQHLHDYIKLLKTENKELRTKLNS